MIDNLKMLNIQVYASVKPEWWELNGPCKANAQKIFMINMLSEILRNLYTFYFVSLQAHMRKCIRIIYWFFWSCLKLELLHNLSFHSVEYNVNILHPSNIIRVKFYERGKKVNSKEVSFYCLLVCVFMYSKNA